MRHERNLLRRDQARNESNFLSLVPFQWQKKKSGRWICNKRKKIGKNSFIKITIKNEKNKKDKLENELKMFLVLVFLKILFCNCFKNDNESLTLNIFWSFKWKCMYIQYVQAVYVYVYTVCTTSMWLQLYITIPNSSVTCILLSERKWNGTCFVTHSHTFYRSNFLIQLS